MEYDVIGDVHGQAGKLEALLRKLGYVRKATGWVPPVGRQAIFLGDLIDRGPEEICTVDTVRRLVDAGRARCIMGNHEFNALGFALPAQEGFGGFMRPHNAKNVAQHEAFLREVGEGSGLHKELLRWFATLPPALDLGPIRAVHAWWNLLHVETVRNRLEDSDPMDEAFLRDAYRRGSAEWRAMEGLTKGLEVELPDGHSFFDHQGVERSEVRARWWLEAPRSYRDLAIVGDGQQHRVPDVPLPKDYAPVPIDGTPIFVGHYWMTGRPVLESSKLACLDWSAARSGPLVAYRWGGEEELDAGNFVASDDRFDPVRACRSA